jgi:integrase
MFIYDSDITTRRMRALEKDRVETFLNTFRNRQTGRVYRYALAEYFRSVYGKEEKKLEPQEQLQQLKIQADQYFTETRNVEDDITNFYASIKDKSPKTIKMMISAVKSFFISQNIELSTNFWRSLLGHNRLGSKALTQDRVPSNKELRQIINPMPLQGKALYLLMASSAMRPTEALHLRMDDLELDLDPPRVHIRVRPDESVKSGNSRTTFISYEAKEAIEEWLRVRDEYLKSAVGRSRFEKKVEDPHLFPFMGTTARAIWVNALKKAGFLKKDSVTKRLVLHPQGLRKFFRTRMGSTNIPIDVIEEIMGHDGYLTEEYRKYTDEELATFYKRGEKALLISPEAEEAGKLRQEVEQLSSSQQVIITNLTAKNIELETSLKKVINELKKVQDDFYIEQHNNQDWYVQFRDLKERYTQDLNTWTDAIITMQKRVEELEKAKTT